MSGIVIQPINNWADILQVEDVQRVAWGTADREIVPGHLLRAMVYNGGVLLGAYDGEAVVGFILMIHGLGQAVPHLYSCTMGVRPAYQNQGIGERLKWAQRAIAGQRGLSLVTWTFDPLASRNAWLNIGKLGVTCQTYLPDFYGEGMDRFYVNWAVATERVQARQTGDYALPTVAELQAQGAVLVNEKGPTTFDKGMARLILVAIPAGFSTLRAINPDLAQQWRLHTRAIFSHYFTFHYHVTEFIRGEEMGYYLLVRQPAGL